MAYGGGSMRASAAPSRSADQPCLRQASGDIDILRARTTGDGDIDLVWAWRAPQHAGIATTCCPLHDDKISGKMCRWQSGQGPQLLLDLTFGQAGLIERSGMVHPEEQQGTIAAAVHRRHVAGDLAQDLVRAHPLTAGDVAVVRGFEHRDRTVVFVEAAIDMERRPRVRLLMLAADIGVTQR